MPGKGSTRRPVGITREEENIRWLRALGKITFEQFEEKYKELKKKGFIKRDGRVVK